MGGVSWTLSQAGISLQAPSPLQSHSQRQAASAAGQDPQATATANARAGNLMRKSLPRLGRGPQCGTACRLLRIVTHAGWSFASRIGTLTSAAAAASAMSAYHIAS